MRRAQGYPRHLERQLAARLRRRQRLLRGLVLEHLAHLPARTDEAGPPPPDSWWRRLLSELLPRVQRALATAAPITPASLLPLAASIDAVITAQIARQVAAAQPGIAPAIAATAPLRTVRMAWAEATAARVRAMEDAVVRAALTAAEAAADAGRDVGKAAGVALRAGDARAAVVARDSVGSMQARVSASRAPGLGSSGFVWRSVGDDRVRELHVELDGQTFSWVTGHPTEGFPGDPPNCRCHAEAL